MDTIAIKKNKEKASSNLVIFQNAYQYAGRNPAQGQKLTANISKELPVTYEILAYTPARPTRVVAGSTIIPYQRGEDLYLTDNKFDIVIEGRGQTVYKVYPVPDPFVFRNMKSQLTFAFYEKDVPFSLDTQIAVSGLGTRANLHPYTKNMKIFYSESSSADEAEDHLVDYFNLTTESASVDKGTLRYSLESIPIFPADYSSSTCTSDCSENKDHVYQSPYAQHGRDGDSPAYQCVTLV